MSVKKVILIVSFLCISGLVFGTNVPSAQAATQAELQALIVQLKAQIVEIQKQLAEIQGEEVWCYDFNRNLKYENSGSEVKALQTALQKQGFYKGTITSKFDEFTASAVVGFQEKYKKDILAPWGLAHGTGFVGPTTRQKLNAIYSCGVVPPSTEKCWDNDNCKKNQFCEFSVGECKGQGKCIAKPELCYTLYGPVCGCDNKTYSNNCTRQIAGVSKKHDGKCETEKSITVLSPNGGEEFRQGENITITWDSTGIDYTVDIGLLDWGRKQEDGSTPFILDLVNHYPASERTYTWKIYSDWPTGNLYKIKVISASGKYDLSDNYFSIVEKTTCTDTDGGKDYYVKGTVTEDGKIYTDYCQGAFYLKEYFCSSTNAIGLGGVAEEDVVCPNSGSCINGACTKAEPSITVLSPNGGEEWVIGNSYEITWSSLGVDDINIYARKIDSNIVCSPCISGMYCPPCDGTLISKNLSASLGKYLWTIPSNIVSGDKYKIQIGDPDFYLGYSNIYDESDNYFSIVEAGTNLSPVIDGLTAPTQLKINEQGTWTIKTHDPENGRLNYSVRWGDEYSALSTEQKALPSRTGVQTTTFTHSYSRTGTYTISFTVTDDHQQTAKTSTTVEVVSEITCTDTDGGKDYYIKGTVKRCQTSTTGGVACEIATDECRNCTGLLPSPVECFAVKEYYCDGTEIKSEIYTCPNNCENGACVKKTEPSEKSITVLSPNGGEQWVIGNSYDITWSSLGVDDINIYARKIDSNIVCSPCISGMYCPPCDGTLISKNLSASLGKYLWTIPSNIVSGDKYKIQIGDPDFYLGYSNIYDESDNYFSIVESGGVGLKSIENQIALVSEAVLQLIERIKRLKK